jgi:hypothetical protein
VILLRITMVVLLASSACTQSAPTGQVVARIDGIEVTRRDVLIELMASGAPADVDTQTVRPALLDRIVVRKLLAEEARRQSVDRSPEFLGQERRSREIILGEQLTQRVVGRLPPPSPITVAAFVATNLARFDRHEIFRIDRITTAAQPEGTTLRLPSNDAIADRLHDRNAAFKRELVNVDSLALTTAQRAALNAAGGRPFIAGAGGPLSIDQVVATILRPVPTIQRNELATAVLHDMDAQQAMITLTAKLRAGAQIEYATNRAASR